MTANYVAGLSRIRAITLLAVAVAAAVAGARASNAGTSSEGPLRSESSAVTSQAPPVPAAPVPAASVASNSVDPAALGKVHDLARRMSREQAHTPDVGRGFFLAPSGDVVSEFEPVTKAQLGPSGAANSTGTNLLKDWSGRNLFSPQGATPANIASQTGGFQYNLMNGPQQQVVHFVGQDNDIYELTYLFSGTGWQFADLTKITSAEPAVGPLVNYQTSFNNQEHIVYLGVDGDIHELWYNNAWFTRDLTTDTKSPQPVGLSLVGYQTIFNNQEHVDFIVNSGDIYELMYDTAWHTTDITATVNTGAGAQVVPPAASDVAISALDGYQTTFNNQQHVNFIAATGDTEDVFELVYDTQWHVNDLTVATGGSPISVKAPLVGYQTTFNSQQHVDYIDGNGHVIEMLYNNGAWVNPQTDLTSRASTPGVGAPVANVASPLAAYQTPFNNQEHVDFVDTVGNVIELEFDTAWHATDLTSSGGLLDGGVPTVQADLNALDGYYTTSPNQQHVNFVSTSNHHVYDLYFDTSWHAVDLTAFADVPWVEVQGTWVVPQVNKPLQPPGGSESGMVGDINGWISAAWVGLDGNGRAPESTSDVLQAGSYQVFNDDGTTSYFMWYEWNAPPDHLQTTIPCSVSPGQTLTADISYQYGFNLGAIFIANLSTGCAFSTALTPPPGANFAGASAEWIVEDPNGGEPNFALAAFTPVVFTQASATNAAGHVGNPIDAPGETDNIGLNGVQLTNTIVSSNQVTIDFNDWLANDLTQTTGGNNQAAGTAIVGYQTTFNGQEHVIYIGTNSHVYELVYGSAWQVNDLTNDTNAPTPAPGSALTGYQTTSPNQQHVDYIDGKGEVIELYFDTSWHPNNLMQATPPPAPPALVTSALNGYATTFNIPQQHVDYVSATDGHLYELYYDTMWHPAYDLTKNTGAPPPVSSGPLAGYQTTYNTPQQHVDFISATNGDLYELYYDTQWHTPTDLTKAATGAPPQPLATGPFAAYQTTFDDEQHVNFMGPNGHVWELSYDTQWHANDLNVAAGIPSTTAVTGALDGYQTLAPNQRHVDFISAANNHVFELYYDTSWHPRDLTSVPVPTPPVPIGRITGFTTTVVNNQQHVDYVAFGGDVIELVH